MTDPSNYPSSVSNTQPQPQPSPAEQTPPSQPTQLQQQPQQSNSPSASDTTEQFVSNPPPPQSLYQHPAVQRASLIHSIAQSLAGGPRYKTEIDPNTGTTTRTQVPVSNRNLVAAIALEALSGGLAGLSQTGPNHAARGAMAGFQTGQQIAQQGQQQDEQQAQQANADYVRQASIANTNFQTHQNALRLGQMEYDQHKRYTNDAQPVLDSLNQVGAIKEQRVREADLMSKYHVTKDMAVVDGVVPRMNPDGTQAKNRDGSLAWDNTYSVIDPEAKIELPQQTAQLLAAYHVPGYYRVVDGKTVPVNLPADTQMKARMVVDGLATASAITITEAGINKQLESIPKDGAADAAQFNVNLRQSLEDGTVTPKALKTFAKYSGFPLDQAFALMEKDKVDPDVISQIGSLVPSDVREQIRMQRVALEERNKRDADTQSAIEKAKALGPVETANAVAKERAFVGIRAQTAGAEERARQQAKPSGTALTTPDALGFVPTVSDAKEASKRFGAFKKNLDALSQSEQSYSGFQQALSEINQGKWTGADSVVSLFNAIGLSAIPLSGKGFRVSSNVIAEHQQARGWQGALQARLSGIQSGAIITPQQLKDYAGIASQARSNQIIATVNELHNSGLSGDAALPVGNGQRITPDTAQVFLKLTGNDPDRARQAAAQKGWQF